MKRLLTLLLACSLMLGCTTSRPPNGKTYPFPEEQKTVKKEGKKNGPTLPFASLKVPKGHLPPPGLCKIWYPNKPPGHQPAAQSCASAIKNVPLGAWVITHEGTRYKVNIFNSSKKGIIDEVRYYLTE